ncbi:MAG TPA: [Fe-Fe] hydrogenase large subunit C-terminal domain-containing protein [Bacteroidales bacterium]|nr:[Fe-Fe] hydrogenase large subunit C-terminal domain-containing protein [Bacteroidales bacterium]HPS73431.1 [Fe-Fe] hydrogenase large subunit C-terminal domain-containing protein [Bacteroidales bacterium]
MIKKPNNPTPDRSGFHHALKVIDKVCMGCTHCMTSCPTQAIRVVNGLAVINGNRCVDCGMCMRACPVKAIYVDHDDFNKIFKYKQRVALVPSVLLGQFPEDITLMKIFSILHEIGFNMVVEVEQGIDIVKKTSMQYIKDHPDCTPFISSFCPAIIRLIQVRFPSLVNHIIHVKAPLEATAFTLREKFVKDGLKPDEIGIFYITPCAAKIAAIKSPVEEEPSPITGVINMNFLYNKIYSAIKSGKKDHCAVPDPYPLAKESILWSLTEGEIPHYPGRALAIDEIHNVIEFLEKLENNEIEGVDFLELRACDESCPGGVLTVSNRFLTVERLKKRSRNAENIIPPNHDESGIQFTDVPQSVLDNMQIEKIMPRSILTYDEDISKALDKISETEKLWKKLPDLDCAACGSPTCQALAEDIVMGTGNIRQCFLISNTLEDSGKIEPGATRKEIERIWGKKIKDQDQIENI